MKWLAGCAVLASCFQLPDRHPIHDTSGDAHAGGDGAGGDGITTDGKRNANYVFMTSSTFTLTHTGAQATDDANAFCQQAAFQSITTSPVRGHYYKAWMSADPVNVGDVLRASQARAWIRTDGAPVAATVEDLTDGSILSTINLDENGDAAGNGQVMTGTASSGYSDVGADANCTQGHVEIGDPTKTDARWTEDGYQPCTTMTLRLYCFGYDVIGEL